MKRSPARQVEDFIAANDKSPVVYGSRYPHGIIQGGRITFGGGYYRLKDGTKHKLGERACKLMPEGYPKWDI